MEFEALGGGTISAGGTSEVNAPIRIDNIIRCNGLELFDPLTKNAYS
jgi:hypothetical protein